MGDLYKKLVRLNIMRVMRDGSKDIDIKKAFTVPEFVEKIKNLMRKENGNA